MPHGTRQIERTEKYIGEMLSRHNKENGNLLNSETLAVIKESLSSLLQGFVTKHPNRSFFAVTPANNHLKGFFTYLNNNSIQFAENSSFLIYKSG